MVNVHPNTLWPTGEGDRPRVPQQELNGADSNPGGRPSGGQGGALRQAAAAACGGDGVRSRGVPRGAHTSHTRHRLPLVHNCRWVLYILLYVGKLRSRIEFARQEYFFFFKY